MRRLTSPAIFFRLCILFAGLGSFLMFPHKTLASASQNVSGWAWSENVGWISFNNSSGGGAVDYGVNINTLTGEFSGYAWSENVGWISFNRADTGAPPAAPYNGGETYTAKLNLITLQTSGWARALANGDGWDGWIKFAGASGDGSGYGVIADQDNGEFMGWAWGGDTMGWISFNCANTNTCAAVSYSVKSPFSPVAYWKFNEGAGGDAADSSGHNLTATVTGMQWQSESACKFGACVGTDSNGDSVSSPASAFFDTKESLTYSTWVKFGSAYTTNAAPRWPRVMANNNGDTHKGYGFRYQIPANAAGNAGNLYFEWGLSSCDGSSYTNLSLGSNLLDDKWHFAAATYDGATVKIYLDGVLKNQAAHAGGLCSLPANAMKMAERDATGTPNISLDETKVYSYSRSAVQIRTEYQQLVLNYDFDDWVSGDEETVIDSSGNGNHGITHYGANATGMNCATLGKVAGACQFDGVDDYVTGAESGYINQTQEVWIKLTALPADGHIISRGSCGNGRLIIAGGKVRWQFGSSTTCQHIDSDSTILTNQWYHIAATNNNGALKIYINGVLDKTGIYTIDPIVSSAITIGSYNGTVSFFPGYIDDFAVYAIARTDSQIKEDYEGKVAYFKTNEGSGVVLNDASLFSNTATGNGTDSDDWVFGKLGGALDFDRADSEYSEVVSPIGISGMKAGTLSAWVYKKGGYAGYQPPVSLVNATKGYMFDLNVYNADGRFYSHLCSTLNCGGSVNELISNAQVPVNQWTHLAATFDGQSQILYMNGKEAARRAHQAWLNFPDGDDIRIRLGRNINEYFDGSVDEVKIYSRALDLSEVVSDYRSGFSPAAHWKLNDAASGNGQPIADSSGNGNNALTANDVSCSVPGVRASACQFDSVDDYIAVPASSSLNVGGGFTVSAWVNATGAGREGIVINGGTTGSDINTSYTLYIDGFDNAGKARGRISNGISIENVIGTTSGLADGSWHHIAFTSDGSFLSIYVDGSLETTVPQTIERQVNQSFVTYIGTNTRDTAGWSLDGLLDDVRVYQYARSQSQIQADYNGLIGWWKFDDASGDIAADSSGNERHAVITDSSWRDEALCRAGKCLFYDGSGDYVYIINDSDLAVNGALTGSAWIYPIGLPASPDNGIMGTGINGGYSLTYHTNGNVYFYIGNGANYIKAFASPDRFHHVAGVWDGTTDPDGMKLYIDGALAGTRSSAFAAIAPSRNFLFGRESSDFNGFIDEAKLYSRALSAAEVAQEFGSVPSNLVLRLKMDDNIAGDGKTIADVSGNGNNGTTKWGANAQGMDCMVFGKQGGACLFDGVDDYIAVADDPSLNPANFTITGWVYWKGGGEIIQNIVSKMDDSATKGYRLYYSSGGEVSLTVGNGAGDVDVATVSGALPVTAWTHVGGVYDGSSLKIYLNGVPAASSAMTGSLVNADRFLAVGSHDDSNGRINGMLDEVRLYSYALTAEQMNDDYQKGFAPVSHWKLDDGSGIIASDESENENDGELFGPVWRSEGECVFGVCLFFDGVNDYIDAGDDQSLRIQKALTLSAWIKPSAIPLGDDSGIIGTGIDGSALTYDNDGKVWFYIDSPGNNLRSALAADGAWHHVAGVWNGTTDPDGMKLYIDGEIADARQSLVTSISGWQNFTIGSATTKFQGYIDDVRVYNYARSESEIRLDYAAALPLPAPLNVRNPAGSEFNTLTSIIFQWDPVPLATTYYVYVLMPDLNWGLAGITNTASFLLITDNPGNNSPLVPDTSYNIKVMAVDDVSQSPASIFSDIGIAATSAHPPVGIAGVQAADAGESLWTWESGGRDSGYFARLATDSKINSGWMPLRVFDGTFTRLFGYRPFSGVVGISAQKGILITQYDDLKYSYGSRLLDGVYENFNPFEGTLEFWIQPHWDFNDGKTHTLFDAGSPNLPIIEKTSAGSWRFAWIGDGDLVTFPAVHAAGDFIHIVASWDVNTVLDASGFYARLTINGVNTYGAASPLTLGKPGGNFILGNNAYRTAPIDALVSGRIMRRALSLAEIIPLYAAGNGSPSTFTADTDTVWLSDFTSDTTEAKYSHQGQGITSATAFSVTVSEPIGMRSLQDDDSVVIYDGTAYVRSGFVAGTIAPTDVVIPLDDGGGGAIPDLEYVGGMLEFNGQTDYALFGNQPTLNMGTSDWSIAAWVRTTKGSGTGVIFGKKQSGGFDKGYRLAIKDGRVLAALADGSSVYSVSDGGAINDGRWHHVAAVFDRDLNITRYVDGVSVGTSVSIASLDGVDISNSFQGAIGTAGLLGAELFNGDIAEVQAYRKALNAAQVNALFGSPKKNYAAIKSVLGFTDADIRGLWQLYRNTAPIITDLSVNGNNGAITGAGYRKEAVAQKLTVSIDRAAASVAEPSTREQSRITEVSAQSVPHTELSIVSIADGAVYDTITTSPGSSSAFQINDPVNVFDGPGYAVSGFIKDVLSDSAVTVDDGAGGDILSETVGWHAAFDGTKMAQMAADSNELDAGGGDISISAWIKTTDATGDGSNRIVSKMTGNIGYEMYYNDITGKIGAAIGDNDGNISGGTISSQSVGDGSWHHVALTFDRDDKATVYIDGSADGTLKIAPEDIDGNSLPIASADNAAKFTIGADSDGKRNFTGDIRDARILIGNLWIAGEIAAQAVNPWDPLDPATGTNTEYWLFNGSSNKTVSAGINTPARDVTLANFNQWKQTAFIKRTNTAIRPNDTVMRERGGILIDGKDTLKFPAKGVVSNIEGTIALWVKFLLPGSLMGPTFSPTLLDITSGNSQIYLGHDGGNNRNLRYWIKDSAGAQTLIATLDVSAWQTDEWHRIILQWDTVSDAAQLIDHTGVVSSASFAGNLDDFSNANIFVGTRADGTRQADAYMDSVYALNYWHPQPDVVFNQDRLREWTMRNTPCGSSLTVSVAAANRDGDQTEWKEGFGGPFKCSKGCVTASDCSDKEVCSDTGTYKECLPEGECYAGNWCSKFYNGSDHVGMCRSLPPNACDVLPESQILIKSIDHATRTVTMSAELSSDDITPVNNLQARWDFDYTEGGGGEPNWSAADNYDYNDSIKANTVVSSYAYSADGTYIVALQIRDDGNGESAVVSRPVSIVAGGGKIVAISPVAFPSTNALYSYDAGTIQATKTKDISLLLCNLGGDNLLVSNLSLLDGTKFSILCSGSPCPLPFTLSFDRGGPPPECTTNNDSLSRKFITIRFDPGSIAGLFTDTFTITTDGDNDLTGSGAGVVGASLRGQAVNVILGSDVPVEEVIYEGRTIINPPPGFVEFLENLRFVEPAKPR